MMTGLPCSGKSRWITREQIYLPNWSLVILSTDNIIEKICLDNGFTYNEAFFDLIKFAEKAMYRDLENIKFMPPNLIFWDQTNLTRSIRAKKLATFNEIGGTNYKKVLVAFDAPKALIMERNVRPGKIIPENVIDDMLAKFEKPDETEEGFDEVIFP
jgi:tRNA uridine 5-carbamoylmethylation protein Kti12